MKRIVVHIRLFPLKVIIRLYVPHRRLGATDQDQKQTFGDRRLGQVLIGHVMLALPCHTIDNRNVVRLGIPRTRRLNRPANRIRCALSRVPSDPVSARHHAETAGAMPHPEVSVENDAVHAIVAATQQSSKEAAQTV